MPEAVIVATARTPIGRAFKGSFVDERADDMAAFIVDVALNKVPELDRNTVDDLMLGCGLPGGEQGFNMGRVVAVLAGMRKVPGCTITRYCSSSLQTLADGGARDQGRRGRRVHRRRRRSREPVHGGWQLGPHPGNPEPQVRRPGRAQRGSYCG